MATFIIGMLIFLAFFASGFHIYKNIKKGSCGACSNCPSLNQCNKDFSDQ